MAVDKAMVSAHDTTPGQTCSRATLMLSRSCTEEMRMDWLLGVAVSSVVGRRRRRDASQP
jgi:hypothetical protein